MSLSDRLFAPKGKTQGILEINQDNILISRYKRHILSYLNNSRLTESKSSKNFITKSMPVLSMLINELAPKRINLKQSNENNMLNQLVDVLNRNKNDLEVFVLKLKPDEIVQNKPRQIQAAYNGLPSRIDGYQEDILKISENIKDIKHLSNILLGTTLPKTMWGAKEVQKVLSNMQDENQNINIDKIDFYTEKTKNASEFLNKVISRGINVNLENLNRVIKNISNNFFNIKNIISSMAQNLYGLFDINKTFKNATGYPATWFLDSSIFYDFCYDFENLVNDMIKCARLENNVIEPILIWKIKTVAK